MAAARPMMAADPDDVVVVTDSSDGAPQDVPPSPGSVPSAAAELRSRLSAVPVGARPAVVIGPIVERVKTFSLDFEDQRGRQWRGDFTNHILTVRERIQVGALRAQLLAGAASSAIDEFTADLVEMVAHLSFSIDRRPAWFDDPGQLDDPDVVVAVYREVAAHEVAFRQPQGGRAPPTSGSGDSRGATPAVVVGEVPTPAK